MESCKKQETVDENKQTILVAAGTVLAMACFRRILLMVLIEQWRVKVFLVLNLLLLAIFVTSTRGSSSGKQEGIGSSEMKNGKKKRRGQYGLSGEGLATKTCDKTVERNSKVNDNTEVSSEQPKLSKEDLNERVEAFIAMFRQQLISEARKVESPFPVSRITRREMAYVGNGSKLALSTR